ncbi:family 71 glycosyltransferase [Mollisia scopiformis]|uniref:Family 71 glycosyltransferase n=1 Tax=Mollisia scopiformis TaxID=149040 RepID=A0A132B860_MOLSC|nr:family 71 glycosyltransferase [Mollisia scopiformis]KUJ08179.1 family 71 glycosyltransferase [Mollisia scopiformis]
MVSTPTTNPELSKPSRPPESIQDAHKLPTADDFLSHFTAVTQIKGMTMSEAKSSCSWEVSEEVNFQYGNDSEWAVQDRADEELEFRRNQWHHFINNELLPYESYKDRFNGRGIVIVAGNGKSLKRVRVILRQLKSLGSRLPIELHYWGDEFPTKAQKEMSTLWPSMYFNDLSSSSNILKSSNDNFFHINYQLKTVAVMNSRFAEPLLLDSDNIPIIDPESLFDSDTYKEFGTLFWPDIARTRPNNPIWAITNTQCRMDEYEQESGQLIVDKRKFFYHLQLAAWFNNVHAQYYNEFLLGDKDMFRFAWHALKTKYGTPRKWVTSVGTVAPNGYYCGHSFAQHHPNGSVAFLHGGLLKTIPKAVMKWERESRGGIFQAYKRSVVDERHNLIEKVAISMDGVPYLPNRPEDLGIQWCTDLKDVHPRKLDELVPGFEKTFEDLGGYWMLDNDGTHT